MVLGHIQRRGPLVLQNEDISAVSRYAPVKLNKLGKGNNQRYLAAVSERSLKAHEDWTFQKKDYWKGYRQR